jgi:hypothetical protein
MRPDLLIHSLMSELRSVQRDAWALDNAAIANVGGNLLAEGFDEALALAGQVVALRQKIDGIIATLEPEALEHIGKEILNREHGQQGMH